MPCIKPLIHIKNDTLREKMQCKKFMSWKWWSHTKHYDNTNRLLRLGYIATYPCGSCYHCINMRRYQWVKKLQLERELWDNAYFITLTYDNDHLPEDKQLNVKHTQNFIKKLRYKFGSEFKYFLTGEYGVINARPHYHMILLTNYEFGDFKPIKKTANGTLFRSKTLENMWPFGFTSISYDKGGKSFAYCSAYSNKSFLKQRQNKLYKEFRTFADNVGKINKEWDIWVTRNGIEIGNTNWLYYEAIHDKLTEYLASKKKPEFYTFSKATPLGYANNSVGRYPKALTKYGYRQFIASKFEGNVTYDTNVIGMWCDLYDIDKNEVIHNQFFKEVDKNAKLFDNYLKTCNPLSDIQNERLKLDEKLKKLEKTKTSML